MLFYLTLLFFVTVSSALVSYCKSRKAIFVFKVITFLLISVPGAIRYGIGVDYDSYVNIFYEIKHTGAGYGEPGWILFNQWVADVGGNEQWVFAIMAFATAFFFFKGVPSKRWIIYAPLFILALYGWYFSTVRQMFAASLAFYAWRKADDGRYLPAIISIVVAFFFHYSSLVYPITYLLCKYIRVTKKQAIVIFLICLILSFGYTTTLTSIMTYFVSFSESYGRYADSIWFLEPEIGSGIGVFISYSIWLIIILFFPLRNNYKIQFVYTLFLIYVLFMILSYSVFIINRISRGLIFVLLPVIWYHFSEQYNAKKIVFPLIVLLYFTLFIADLVKKNANLLPFQTCF